MEDYTKCELMGGGAPWLLNTFSNLFIVAVYYAHVDTCSVLLLLLTVSMEAHCPLKIVRTYHILLLLLTLPM